MIKLSQKSKKLLNLVIGISMATLIVGAMTTTSFAWYIAQSKANIIGNNAVIRNSTAMTVGVSYFTGNGTVGGDYEGYDSTTLSAKTVTYGSGGNYYYRSIEDEATTQSRTVEAVLADAFDFSKMQPGKRYSFAFEEVGKNYMSIVLAAFTAHVESTNPYKEMYTGPVAICKDIDFSTTSWFRVHDTGLDHTDDVYNYLGYARKGTRTCTNFGNNASSDGTYGVGAFRCSTAGAFDVVIFGDGTVGVYAKDASGFGVSDVTASQYKFYGYNHAELSGDKRFGTSDAAPADQANSTFKYVDQATINAWNTTGKHTKYISSAALVAGYCGAYELSNTSSTNDSTASTYTIATVDNPMSLVDKISYRYGADVGGGEASGDTAGDSAATYQLGHTSDNKKGTQQIYFLTIAMPDVSGNKLKPFCKRGSGANEKIYYIYSSEGSYEPYFGIDAGLGNFTLS